HRSAPVLRACWLVFGTPTLLGPRSRHCHGINYTQDFSVPALRQLGSLKGLCRSLSPSGIQISDCVSYSAEYTTMQPARGPSRFKTTVITSLGAKLHVSAHSDDVNPEVALLSWV